MDHETNEPIDLIDLGIASAETQGADKGDVDMIGFIPTPGLTDD